MIRIFTLLWTLLAAVVATGIGFFYINGEARGFPLSFARLYVDSETGVGSLSFNYLILIIDIVFWWLVFSILVVVLKNYVFDL